MLSHYVKVSFRELLKYRTQSIVSIIGLAVGFTAFILGGYWLWWETHFDNFHTGKLTDFTAWRQKDLSSVPTEHNQI